MPSHVYTLNHENDSYVWHPRELNKLNFLFWHIFGVKRRNQDLHKKQSKVKSYPPLRTQSCYPCIPSASFEVFHSPLKFLYQSKVCILKDLQLFWNLVIRITLSFHQPSTETDNTVAQQEFKGCWNKISVLMMITLLLCLLQKEHLERLLILEIRSFTVIRATTKLSACGVILPCYSYAKLVSEVKCTIKKGG